MKKSLLYQSILVTLLVVTAQGAQALNLKNIAAIHGMGGLELKLNLELKLTSSDCSSCTSADCKAIMKGEENKCESYDCRALVSGKSSYCDSDDCRGLVDGANYKCDSDDCRGLAKGESFVCDTDDCRGLVKDQGFLCETSDCKSLVKGGAVCGLGSN